MLFIFPPLSFSRWFQSPLRQFGVLPGTVVMNLEGKGGGGSEGIVKLLDMNAGEVGALCHNHRMGETVSGIKVTKGLAFYFAVCFCPPLSLIGNISRNPPPCGCLQVKAWSRVSPFCELTLKVLRPAIVFHEPKMSRFCSKTSLVARLGASRHTGKS